MDTIDELKRILAQLVAFPSITPEDKGCQEFMIEYLEAIGFSCQRLNQGPVSNFFACYGNQGPILAFAGHTDVVPVGELSQWHSPPFVLTEQEERLYGRGVADMKGSLACMLVMAKRFVSSTPSFPGRLAFLITSGEEGDDYDLGTPYLMQQLQQQGIHLDYCIVGEPSSTQKVGDVIKVGRRGSLHASIRVHGQQGHVAYPHLAINPIHQISAALAELTQIQWDKGNDYFPPTSMQITHIHSGGQANNIIPGALDMHFNVRYSTEQTEQGIKQLVHELFERHQIQADITWRLSGAPFLTQQGLLRDSCQQAILHHTGQITELSTSGGTSDGRFIAPYGVEVIELGLTNASIHQVNECIAMHDLSILESLYFDLCQRLLGSVHLSLD